MKIISSVVLFFVLVISFSNSANAGFSCLPTCSAVDARFLSFGGQMLNTFVFDTITFGMGSPPLADTIEIGIFDGEADNKWDEGPGDELEFTLFADPMGDGSGTVQVGQWSSNGTFGNNTGNPMPDNDWFVITIDNAPEARAGNGNFLYFMVVRNLNTDLKAVNNFKVRTDGTLFIFPTDQPFGYEASIRGVPTILASGVLDIVYPNFDPNDPNCCLSPTTYDGCVSFFFLLEEEQSVLNFWDGDFDFGQKLPSEGPPFEDTDDPNTPIGIPSFADAPNTNEQTSAGTIPVDDSPFPVFVRPPNIIYELISPTGEIYTNNNPSATNEWELFQLNTEPGCAPDICDIQVDNIPAGIWEVKITGVDMSNINFIRGFEKIVGVDEDEEPVPPLSPPGTEPIPTISKWGMLTVVVFLGIIGLYFIKRRKPFVNSN